MLAPTLPTLSHGYELRLHLLQEIFGDGVPLPDDLDCLLGPVWDSRNNKFYYNRYLDTPELLGSPQRGPKRTRPRPHAHTIARADAFHHR